MIQYKRGGIYFLINVFRRAGSVFPTALALAVPCAAATFCFKWFMNEGYMPALHHDDSGKSILKDNASWSGFMFLVGFLIVFRTSQAYARFWEGCTAIHAMRAEWMDAALGISAFVRYSRKGSKDEVNRFMHRFVRVMSMLHAAALADLEDSNSDQPEDVSAFNFELLDPGALDDQSLRFIRDSENKVELVFQWIQIMIVEAMDTVLDIPAPILSRGFQQLGNGMVQFHDAIKLSTIPFPFPYAQTCDALLIIHWFMTPLVVSQWVTEPWWGAVFSFLQVFIYWCLNLIAVEIENPFGTDDNDISLETLHMEFNEVLCMIVEPTVSATPVLKEAFVTEGSELQCATAFNAMLHIDRLKMERPSFIQVWTEIENGRLSAAMPVKCARRLGRGGSAEGFIDEEVLAYVPTGPARRRVSKRSDGEVRRHSMRTSAGGLLVDAPGEKRPSNASSMSGRGIRLKNSMLMQPSDGQSQSSFTAVGIRMVGPTAGSSLARGTTPEQAISSSFASDRTHSHSGCLESPAAWASGASSEGSAGARERPRGGEARGEAPGQQAPPATLRTQTSGDVPHPGVRGDRDGNPEVLPEE